MTLAQLITSDIRPILGDEVSPYTFSDAALVGLCDWAEAHSVMLLPYEATRALQVEATRDITAAATGKVVATVDISGLTVKAAQIISAEFRTGSAARYYVGERVRLEDFFSHQSAGLLAQTPKTAPKWAIWKDTIYVAPDMSGTNGCNLRYLGRTTRKTATGDSFEIAEEYQRDLAHLVCAVAFTRLGSANEAQFHYIAYGEWLKSVGGKWSGDLLMAKAPMVPNVDR